MKIDFNKTKPKKEAKIERTTKTTLLNIAYLHSSEISLKVLVKKKRINMTQFFIYTIKTYISENKQVRRFEAKESDLKRTTILVEPELKQQMEMFVANKGSNHTDLFLTIVEDYIKK